MILEVPRENLDVLLGKGMAETQSSDDLYANVITARDTQEKRYKQTTFTSNADLQG
jgi:predicted ATPase with chaperone activity